MNAPARMRGRSRRQRKPVQNRPPVTGAVLVGAPDLQSLTWPLVRLCPGRAGEPARRLCPGRAGLGVEQLWREQLGLVMVLVSKGRPRSCQRSGLHRRAVVSVIESTPNASPEPKSQSGGGAPTASRHCRPGAVESTPAYPSRW